MSSPHPVAMNFDLSQIPRRQQQLFEMVQQGELAPWTVHQQEFLTQAGFFLFSFLVMLALENHKVFLNRNKKPIFLHVRYDYQQVIDGAATFYHGGNGPIFLDGTEGQHRSDPFPGGKPKAIWDGFSFWRDKLVEKGVREIDIIPTGAAYNTPDEHEEMIWHAKEHNWQEAIIIGNSYQMPRITLGTIQRMRKHDFWLQCFFAVTDAGDWNQDMLGPQGQNDGPLFNQLWEEFKRIPEYQLKGDLCLLHEAMNYFIYGRDSVVDHKLTLPIAMSAVA